MVKRVFISGVTGTMGEAGLKHLLKHQDKLEIVTLVRPSKSNIKQMKKYQDKIEVIYGDLTIYADVKKALKNVDYILHVAALVSPEADDKPELAYKVNVGSIKNILKAIKALNLTEVKLVNIGTVAQTGDRMWPLHWGRVGDPLKPSVYDYYATSKIKAERLVIESNLKYWVSLRQTGILHYGLLSIMQGIIFHQPLNNVLEWITEEDSGRLLANIVLKDLPAAFYQNVYNIGGGESCRINNYNFMAKMFKVIGINDIEKIFEPNWFATKNFHGQYYLDSDTLNEYLDFRRESIDDFIVRLKTNLKFYMPLLKYLPNVIIKNLIMKRIVKSDSGPLNWINKADKDKIESYFGSLDAYHQIKSWDEFIIIDDYSQVKRLSHGYNETKALKALDIEDLKQAANYRGGKLLSHNFDYQNIHTPLAWSCGFGHKFMASPYLVLKTGHWCPACAAPPWKFNEIARVNDFFNQVYQ